MNHETTDVKSVPQLTPYDTGKIKIGVYYEPPKQRQSNEDLMLQSLLLGDKTPYMPNFRIDVRYIFYVALGVLVYVGAIALTR